MRFHGILAFHEGNEQTKPGIFRPIIVEKTYRGEVLRNYRGYQKAESQQNENLFLNNRISVISDLYLRSHWPSILYVLWDGVKWKVKSVDLSNYPRAILEIGGIYHGPETSSTS